jgi:GTP-binding protein Era
VALLGRPNVGKSTLLNAFVGEKLSIVTAKAQTTWQRVVGIHSAQGAQMIFLDTPGLLEARDLLQRSMVGAALEALSEADVLLVLVDPTRTPGGRGRSVLQDVVARSSAPRFVAVNKIDAAPQDRVDELAIWAREELHAEVHRVSALRGTGVVQLRDALEGALPESPFLYPPDELAAAPVRFFVAELIRETVFEHLREEIPYSVFCTIEEFRESEDPVYVLAHLFVERNSQKRILIGEGGRTIRALGERARAKVESFIERRIYLDLWVKVLPGWRRKRSHLRRLGFRVPDQHEIEFSS